MKARPNYVSAAHEHFRRRYGHDPDTNDPTDRELLATSAVEVVEELRPGALVVGVGWDRTTTPPRFSLSVIGPGRGFDPALDAPLPGPDCTCRWWPCECPTDGEGAA